VETSVRKKFKKLLKNLKLPINNYCLELEIIQIRQI
jgi:hypothetical protein